MTEFQSIGQIAYSFDRPISTTNSHHNLGRFYSNLQGNLPLSKQELAAKIKEAFEVEKLSFVDVVLDLGVSPTTIRRICRTLEIGRYSDQIPSELRSNSSQQPYGWKSVNGVLEKEPSEWRCVELMFQLREQGLSLHKIAADLTHRKIPTKNGGRWFSKSISQILKFNEKFLNNQTNDRRIK
ncbi:MAG: recombinase family protein [Xanthomonadaceae bacterium]|nr:recombinase family protein [Xanthomonadaceae bacterium]